MAGGQDDHDDRAEWGEDAPPHPLQIDHIDAATAAAYELGEAVDRLNGQLFARNRPPPPRPGAVAAIARIGGRTMVEHGRHWPLAARIALAWAILTGGGHG